MAQLTPLASIRTVDDVSDLHRMRTNDIFFSQVSQSEDASPPRLTDPDSFSSPEQTSVAITIGRCWHQPAEAGVDDNFLHPTRHGSPTLPEGSLPQFHSRIFRQENACDRISEFLQEEGQSAKGLIVMSV
jgi:hypothetical protein